MFFDSNILIYFVENNEEFSDAATELIARALENNEATFSVLALTETMSRGQSAKELAKLEHLEKVVNFIDTDKEMSKLAGKLRLEYPSLKTPDAIHLATALCAGADIFITNDKHLAKAAKKLLPTKTL